MTSTSTSGRTRRNPARICEGPLNRTLTASLRGANIPRLFCAAATLLPSLALAAPGEHIRTGDAVIVPHVSLGLEYYTNPYHSERTEPGSSAMGLNVSPGLDIRLGGDDVDFDFGGVYELRKFIGDQDQALDRFSDFSIKADLNANKQGVIGLRLHEGVGLKNQPADATYSENPFVTQTRNQTTGSVVVRPGPAFELDAGGLFELDDYAFVLGTNTPGARAFNTRFSYGPRGGLTWKFLPKTALTVRSEYKIQTWAANVVPTNGAEDAEFPSSTMLRVNGGMLGRVTDKLTVLLTAGYGTAVFDEATVSDPTFAPDATGLQKLLVDLTWRYELSDDDRFAVGFQRDVDPSYFTAFVSTNKGFITGDARFTDRVGVNGEVSLRREAYKGQVERVDSVIDVKGAATYYAQDYASVTLGTQWIERASTDTRVAYDDVRVNVLGTFTY